MRFKLLGILFFTGIFLINPILSSAQESSNDPDKLGAPNIIRTGKSGNKHKLNKQEKQAAKTKAKQQKEADKAAKAAAKFHEKIQSKATKQMMKESRNKSEALHGNKKIPWWKKIFRKKSRGD